MNRNRVLFYAAVLGLLVAPVTLLAGSTVVQAQEKELVPMELDGTDWEVEMVYVTAKGKKEISADTLIFADKKFISKSFKDADYEPTNYSLAVEEDGATRFGTMQVKGKETSFWKGNVKDNAVSGSVHTQFKGGKTRTTYFNGKLISGDLEPKTEVKPEVPTPTLAPVPPVSEKSKETGKKAAEKVQPKKE